MTPLEEIIANGIPLVIPVPETAYSAQRITLDGRTYTLRLSWNTLAASWYLGIDDVEGEPIVDGIRVLTDWPMLRFYRADLRVPPGEFLAQTLTTDVSPPGYDDFGIGKRVELTYYAQGA